MTAESQSCLNVLPIYPSCGTVKTSPEFSPSTKMILSPVSTNRPFSMMVADDLPRRYLASRQTPFPSFFFPSVSWHISFNRKIAQLLGYSKGSSISMTCPFILS